VAQAATLMQTPTQPADDAPHLLLVDDDRRIRDLLSRFLCGEGYRVTTAMSAKDARAKLLGLHFDMLILDVMMPGETGFELARFIRTSSSVPIIMLTARHEAESRIEGLQIGADDYVAKPFRFAVLLARIRAQLRQHEASEDAVFSVGPYSFRPGSKMLTGANAKKVRLTEKETAILRFLYRAGQMPVSRETLLQEVWGYNSGVTTHTLETHIYRLRQKIEKDAANPEILVTEAGGYKLVP